MIYPVYCNDLPLRAVINEKVIAVSIVYAEDKVEGVEKRLSYDRVVKVRR